jgi:carotenoid cleavage dioxygenase
VQDFDGQVMPSPNMSAHEIRCSFTGEYFNVGTWAGELGSNKYAIYRFSADGSQVTSEVFEGPYSCMMHDFVLTENYIVIPFFPSICDVERMKQGGPVWAWEPDERFPIAIIPRDGGVEQLEWIETDFDFYSLHYFNAYENGDEIIVDAIKQNGNFLFPPIDSEPMPFVCISNRWRINLKDKSVTTKDITDRLTELPRIDERFLGRKYQYGFTPMGTGPNPFEHPYGFDTLARIDMDTNERDQYYFGDHALVQEFVFVARSDDAPEGDGYLMGFVNFPLTNTSEFMILDAQDLPAGPLAKVKIPYFISNKVHGGWFKR